MRSYTQRGRELAEEGKIKRKAIMEKMLNELRVEKEGMIKKREEIKKEYKAMDENDPMKAYTLLKIRKIEDDLKAEYYKLVEDKEMDKPSVGKPKAP
jgi:hypothetical protein